VAIYECNLGGVEGEDGGKREGRQEEHSQLVGFGWWGMVRGQGDIQFMRKMTEEEGERLD